MPQLIVENDPYAASTGEALGSLMDGFGGPSIKQQAEAQGLMSRIQLANQQQAALAQKMRDEQADRAARDSAAHAAQRYWEIASPRPVAVNGVEPSRDAMEKWYREQDYLGQTGGLTVRNGTGAHDLASGLGQLQKNYTDAHPVVAPGSVPNTGYRAPQMPAGLTPDGQKKWSEETAKNMAGQQPFRDNAGQVISDIMAARKAYDQGQAVIGPFQGNPAARWLQGAFGRPRETTRADIDNKLARYQKPLVMANLPPGAASDKDIDQARKGMASVTDTSAAAGIRSIDSDMSQVFTKLGVPADVSPFIVNAINSGRVPEHHVQRLVQDLQNGDIASAQEFIDHYGAR